jgi:uncharacterized protein involved in type VI secretion and phage assembly
MRLDFPYKDGPPTATLLVNTLHAHEEVSRGFRFEVEVLSDDARIPLKMMMARMVTISLVRADGSLRYFNGYVTEFRFLRTDGGFAFYRMLLEPWLSYARLRKDNVSFHGKSVREITEAILKHYRQADWHMHSFEDDPRLTVANQHNETDFNHLHRRWEARGLHYWYEHRFGGHMLILSDHSVLCEPIDVIRHDDADVIPFRAKSGSQEDDGIRECNGPSSGRPTNKATFSSTRSTKTPDPTAFAHGRMGKDWLSGAWWSGTRTLSTSRPPGMTGRCSRGGPSSWADTSALSHARWSTTQNRAAASANVTT